MFMLAALPSILSGYARDVWRDRVSARGERGRVRARLRAPLSAQSFLLLWSGRMVGWYYFFKVTNLFPYYAQLHQRIAMVIKYTSTVQTFFINIYSPERRCSQCHFDLQSFIFSGTSIQQYFHDDTMGRKCSVRDYRDT